MITAEQIRAARKLLGWSVATLAKRSRVSYLSVSKAEGPEHSTPQAQRILPTIQRVLEAVGVEFIAENGGGAGVRLRQE